MPTLVVHVEAQPGEVRNETLIPHGQHTGIHRQPLFHLWRAGLQAEGFGEQFVAVEQRGDGLGRDAARFPCLATLRIVEPGRIRQHHQFVAVGGKQ
ncbi:hypothetical protein D3C81_2115410 [compost metagenome]